MVIIHPDIPTSILTKSFRRTLEMKQIFRLLLVGIHNPVTCSFKPIFSHLKVKTNKKVSQVKFKGKIVSKNIEQSPDTKPSMESFEIESEKMRKKFIKIDELNFHNLTIRKSC